MPSVKDQLQEARDLIQDERYNEARRILRKINHPTAEKWLDQLDVLEGKRGRASSGSRSRSGGGFWRVLVRLLMVIIVLGLVVGAYVLYENGTLRQLFPTPEPTRVALGPDGRPLPTPTPEPSSTPVPCEPQVWWDEQEDRITPFLYPEPLRTRSDEAYQTALDALRVSRNTFASASFPDCLADLHSRISTFMDAQLARLDLPHTRSIAFDQTDMLEADQIRQYGDITATSLEQMTAVANTLTELGVDYDDSGQGFSRTIVEMVNSEQHDPNATPEVGVTPDLLCPSLRWLYTEYLPSTYLIARGQNVARNNVVDPEQTPPLVFDLQREAQRLSGQTEPVCLEVQRLLIIETNEALATTLQNLLNSDVQAASTNRQLFNEKLAELTEAVRELPPYTIVTAG